MMDAIKNLFKDGLDPAALLPDLHELFGVLPAALRVAVMAAPLCLLGLGLWYLLAPPKEANHRAGFRCWWGMASVEVWQFTQKIAGLVWTGLGLVLTIVMAIRCNGFRDMVYEDAIWAALWAIVWELGLVAVSIIAINIVVMVFFDRKGYRREFNQK